MHNTSREHKITLTQMEQKFFEEKVIFVVYFFFFLMLNAEYLKHYFPAAKHPSIGNMKHSSDFVKIRSSK